MTIYIVTQSYYTNRDRKRYGVEYFASQGYLVVILDVQDYTNKELKSISRPNYILDDNVIVYECNNFSQIKDVLEMSSKGIAFLYLSDNYQSITIKKYLRKINIKIGVVYEGMLPQSKTTTSNLQKINKKFRNLSLKIFLNLIYKKIYAKIFEIKYYDFLLTSNYEIALENYSFPKPLKIIPIHAFDYDLVLDNRETKNISVNKYIVFLDQYLLYHPDFERTNTKLNIDKDVYFEELNNYFDIVEKKSGYKIIIAAHPRADLSEYKILFNNREVFIEKTVQLVKYCEFTITHYSTAINFAVIYKKPILFLTSNDLQNSSITESIQLFASTLNQPYVNISSLGKDYHLENLKIDLNRYENYKFKYIMKSDSQVKNFESFDRLYLKDLK